MSDVRGARNCFASFWYSSSLRVSSSNVSRSVGFLGGAGFLAAGFFFASAVLV
jgi:hypothetical protein